VSCWRSFTAFEGSAWFDLLKLGGRGVCCEGLFWDKEEISVSLVLECGRFFRRVRLQRGHA